MPGQQVYPCKSSAEDCLAMNHSRRFIAVNATGRSKGRLNLRSCDNCSEICQSERDFHSFRDIPAIPSSPLREGDFALGFFAMAQKLHVHLAASRWTWRYGRGATGFRRRVLRSRSVSRLALKSLAVDAYVIPRPTKPTLHLRFIILHGRPARYVTRPRANQWDHCTVTTRTATRLLEVHGINPRRITRWISIRCAQTQPRNRFRFPV